MGILVLIKLFPCALGDVGDLKAVFSIRGPEANAAPDFTHWGGGRGGGIGKSEAHSFTD